MSFNRLVRDSGFIKGLVVGVVAGLVLGGVGLSAAAFGKKGWDRLGTIFDFKSGYVAGFNDCVRVAKASEPYGFMAATYVLPTAATMRDWVAAVERAYATEKYATSPLSHVMVVVGKELEKTFGPETSTPTPGALETLLRIDQNKLKRMIEERKAKESTGKNSVKDSGGD